MLFSKFYLANQIQMLLIYSWLLDYGCNPLKEMYKID